MDDFFRYARHRRSATLLVLVCVLATPFLLGQQTCHDSPFLDPFTHIVDQAGGAKPVEGRFSVSDDGSANYLVPLQVPAAPGGVQPELALAYNHRGGDGPIGLGWSLVGFSRIHRCQPTLDYEGRVDAIQFDWTDPLCLDGQKLVVISGNLPSGTAELRTDPETFQKVIQDGTDAFIVYLPNGRIRRYVSRLGEREVHTAPPPTLGQPWPEPQRDLVTHAWALEKEEDRVGRGYRVEYRTAFEDDSFGHTFLWSSLLPDSVTYFSAGGDLPRKIEFAYEGRSDPSMSFEAGLKRPSQYLLRSVSMLAPSIAGHNNPSAFRVYNLAYTFDAQLGRSMLGSLEQCGHFGRCTEPLNFEWSTLGYNYTSLPPFEWSSNLLEGGISRSIDIGNDGVSDIDHRASVIFHPEAGAALMQVRSVGPFVGGQPVRLEWGVEAIVGNVNEFGVVGAPMDLDNDGDSLPDWWFRPPFLGGCYFPNGLRTSSEVSNTFGDLDGNGILDLVEGDQRCSCWSGEPSITECVDGPPARLRVRLGIQGGSWPALPTLVPASEWVAPVQFTALDIDGDKRVEVLYEDGRYGLRLSALDWAQGAPRVTPTNLAASSSVYQKFIDVNGDGLVDAATFNFYPYSSWNVRYNTGRGFTQPLALGEFQTLTNPIRYADEGLEDEFDQGIRFTDLNLDGRIDALVFPDLNDPDQPSSGYNGTPYAYISKGTQYEKVTGLTSVGRDVVPKRHRPWNVAEGDFTGDGIADLAHYNAHTDEYLIKRRDGQQPGHLIAVKEATGAEINIEYANLVDAGVHTPGANCDYPQRCVRSGLWVVKTVEHTGPNGIEKTLRHSYEDGRFDNLSGQPIGFAKHTVRDDAAQTCEIRHFRVDAPSKVDGLYRYAGLPMDTWRLTLIGFESGPGMAEVLVEHKQRTFQLTDGDRRRPFLQQEINEKRYYELDLLVATILPLTCDIDFAWSQPEQDQGKETIGYGYDAFGHTVTSLRTVEGVAGSELSTAEFLNDTSDWLIDLQTQSRSISNRNQLTVEQRYDIQHDSLGRAIEIRSNAHVPNAELKTTFSYSTEGALSTVSQEDVTSSAIRRVDLEYDAAGLYPARASNPSGHTTTGVFHSGFGVPTEIIDPDGRHLHLYYDGFGRVVESGIDGLEATTVTYQAFSSSTSTRVASPGGELLTTLDHLQNPVSQVLLGLGSARTRTFEYEPATGQLQRWSNWSFGVPDEFTQLERDNLGRITQIAVPSGATASATYSGFTEITMQDLSGYSSTRHLDPLGQQTALETEVTETLRTDYEYGPFGALLSATDPGGSSFSIAYDGVGRPASTTSPDTGTSSFEYNAFGELIRLDDAAGFMTREYDALGRATRVVGQDGGTDEYHWLPGVEGLGLAWMRSSDGIRTDFAYDEFGRPTTTTTTLSDTSSFALAVLYDTASRVVRMDYPGPHGFGLNLEYEGFLVTKIKDTVDQTTYWEAVDYHPSLRLSMVQLGNGLSEERSYESGSELLDHIRVSDSGGAIFEENAILNANGSPSFVFRDAFPRVQGFTYDQPDRLTQETLQDSELFPSSVETYDYSYKPDGSMSLFSNSIDNVASSISLLAHDGHKLTQMSTITPQGTEIANYDYDGKGRRIVSGELLIDYNGFNLPTEIQTPSETVGFQYDAFGSRTVQTSTAGTKIVSISDLYRERSANGGAADHDYRIRLGLTELAEITIAPNGNRSVRYFHRDLADNLALVTDEGGNVVDRRVFGPFGEVRAGNPSGKPGFVGHGHESYAALINMRGRIYDPQTKSFLSSDPIVAFPFHINGWHGYSYALNSPFIFRDFSGLNTDQLGFEVTVCAVFCLAVNPNLATDQTDVALNLSASLGFASAAGFSFAATFEATTADNLSELGGVELFLGASVGPSVLLSHDRLSGRDFLTGEESFVGSTTAIGGGMSTADAQVQGGVTTGVNVISTRFFRELVDGTFATDLQNTFDFLRDSTFATDLRNTVDFFFDDPTGPDTIPGFSPIELDL